MGDCLSSSAYDFWSSYSPYLLRVSTRSRRFRLVLIYSSVCTNTSNSLFKSRFCCSKIAMCCYKAAISALIWLFLSVMPALLNLTSSPSLRVMEIWSSRALTFASKSKMTAWRSFDLWFSASFCLNRTSLSSFPLSRLRWAAALSDYCLADWSLSWANSAWAASRASVVRRRSNSLASATLESSLALSWVLANS